MRKAKQISSSSLCQPGTLKIMLFRVKHLICKFLVCIMQILVLSKCENLHELYACARIANSRTCKVGEFA